MLFRVLQIQALVNCKLEICKALEIPTEQFELSMGMSGDFEQAVRNSIIHCLHSRDIEKKTRNFCLETIGLLELR